MSDQGAAGGPATMEEAEAAGGDAPARAPVRVLKFGGTSVAGAERLQGVATVVRSVGSCGRPVVVVSALDGVTDRLLAACRRAGEGADDPPGGPERDPDLQELESLHCEVADAVADEAERPDLRREIREHVREVERLVRGVALVGECTDRTRDRVVAHGELLASLLAAATLRAAGLPARQVDARELLVARRVQGAPRLERAASWERIRRGLSEEELGALIPVVPGYIAGTPDGDTTTLGRGASDYTASLLGAALEAERVELWTDVEGIHTADPRQVPDARPLKELAFSELLELASFGARVVFPGAVQPLQEAGIPLLIRSSLDPDAPGTRVVPAPGARGEGPVRGVSAVSGVALLRLENVEDVGLTEVAERLGRTLGRVGVTPLLYTQDSGAHSVSVAVEEGALPAVEEALGDEFRRELRAGLLREPVAQTRRSLLAVVGDGMRETPGVAGRLFATLGEEEVNVYAIAQGSSERTISWVVSADDERRALRAVHRAFLGDPNKPVAAGDGEGSRAGGRSAPAVVQGGTPAVRVGLLGVGQVGSTFLRLLLGERSELGVCWEGVELTGVARSRQAVLAPDGAVRDGSVAGMEPAEDPAGAVVDALLDGDGLPVLVDCTASGDVTEAYRRVLDAGGGVVTANKVPLAGPLSLYADLVQRSDGGRRLRGESTVGAGLPVLRTVDDLRASGDELHRAEGVFSGSLSLVAQRVDEGEPFSRAVREAVERGFAEPHPAADLGLDDILRKVLILGRRAGFALEPETVEVEPPVPSSLLEEGDSEAFLEALTSVDGTLAERSREARERGERLLPLARVTPEGGRVALEPVPADRPPLGLLPGENAVALTTGRWREPPLTIRGAGAGKEVTAAGLVADLRAVEQALQLNARIPGGRRHAHSDR